MGQRWATRPLGDLVARPAPWPRREAAWVGATPSGALPWLLFLPPWREPDLRRHRQQVSGDQNSCVGTLPGRGSAPGFISIDIASSLHEAGVVPPRG